MTRNSAPRVHWETPKQRKLRGILHISQLSKPAKKTPDAAGAILMHGTSTGEHFTRGFGKPDRFQIFGPVAKPASKPSQQARQPSRSADFYVVSLHLWIFILCLCLSLDFSVVCLCVWFHCIFIVYISFQFLSMLYLYVSCNGSVSFSLYLSIGVCRVCMLWFSLFSFLCVFSFLFVLLH